MIMGIFDRLRGKSGNQATEDQQDVSQPAGGQYSDQAGQGGMQTAQNTIGHQAGPKDADMGGYQDPNQPGYQDPTQGGGFQDQAQDQGDQDPDQPGYQDPAQGSYQDPNQGDQGGYDPNQDQYGDQNRDQ
jgi:hypothetical protein